jgi:hypothetical protein
MVASDSDRPLRWSDARASVRPKTEAARVGEDDVFGRHQAREPAICQMQSTVAVTWQTQAVRVSIGRLRSTVRLLPKIFRRQTGTNSPNDGLRRPDAGVCIGRDGSL